MIARDRAQNDQWSGGGEQYSSWQILCCSSKFILFLYKGKISSSKSYQQKISNRKLGNPRDIRSKFSLSLCFDCFIKNIVSSSCPMSESALSSLIWSCNQYLVCQVCFPLSPLSPVREWSLLGGRSVLLFFPLFMIPSYQPTQIRNRKGTDNLHENL